MSQKSANRRDFLRHSTLAAGTLAAADAGCARRAHASSDETLKIALIGCGGRGTGAVVDCLKAAKLLGRPVKLIAVADAFEDRARSRSKASSGTGKPRLTFPTSACSSAWTHIRKPWIAASTLVLMASPPGFRPLQYAAAVQAGKHVFMEKPLCTDAPGYQQIMKANEMADQKGLKVVVGLQRHHQGPYLQGVQEIHDGKLGEIQFLRVYWNGSGGGARTSVRGRRMTRRRCSSRSATGAVSAGSTATTSSSSTCTTSTSPTG